MTTALIILLAVFVVNLIENPIMLSGKVVWKNIAENQNNDSLVTIETPFERKVVLKFNTCNANSLVQIGGESFRNRERELNNAISVGDKILVESCDYKNGLTKDVHRLISISKKS